jgi:hypothetical protein
MLYTKYMDKLCSNSIKIQRLFNLQQNRYKVCQHQRKYLTVKLLDSVQNPSTSKVWLFRQYIQMFTREENHYIK